MPENTNEVELEIRRILSSEEIQFRRIISDEAAQYREFLQKQFRNTTVGIITLAAIGAGLFSWFFSDSVSSTQALFRERVNDAQTFFDNSVDNARNQLEGTIDSKIIDYRLLETFQARLNTLVEDQVRSKETRDLVDDQVSTQAQEIISEIADNVIRESLQIELRKIEDLDVDSLIQKAALPIGALVAFASAEGCPTGWQSYELASGRFLLGTNSTYPRFQSGGSETHTLSLRELPAHSHEYRTTDNGPLHDNGSNFIGGAGRFGQVGSKQTSQAGAGLPHNNMPPYLAVDFCVKS